MNPFLPSRRLAQSASSSLTRTTILLPARIPIILLTHHQLQQRRHNSIFSKLNPFGKRRSKKKAKDEALFDDPSRLRKLAEETTQAKLQSSIFEDEVSDAQRQARAAESSPDGGAGAGGAPQSQSVREHLSPDDLLATTDPDPRSRELWQRKMVMKMVRRGGAGRESRADVIARTERQARHKSPWMATSVKKLVQVARQVSGKNLDDALVQMQFSKKKVAREVRFHLERARDEAVAIHGMGLGRQNGELAKAVPRKIKTKDGEWLDVKDPTRLYVAEAWVNRGPIRGHRLIHMGRGRRSLWKRPSAGISLVLKEEKTRVRMHDEKVAKEQARGPWVHHPNRPVTAQRQYYTW